MENRESGSSKRLEIRPADNLRWQVEVAKMVLAKDDRHNWSMEEWIEQSWDDWRLVLQRRGEEIFAVSNYRDAQGNVDFTHPEVVRVLESVAAEMDISEKETRNKPRDINMLIEE